MEDSSYSPFDAPVKEPKKPETSGGIKMEQITDAELNGKSNAPIDNPTDAPTFEIPTFNDVPDAPGGFGSGDPNAPGGMGSEKTSGSGNGGNGGNGGGGNSSSDSTKVDNGFAKEFSEYTAKWLVDIFFRLLVAGVVKFAKIDVKEVKQAILEGHINEKFLSYVEENNNNIDREIFVSEDEKKFVIEPLKYFLEVKKVQLKPEWMFITGIVMVSGGLIIKAIDLKGQNKVLLDRMIKESQEIKDGIKKKETPPSYARENQESFSFTQPITQSNVEIITDVEEINNDDNSQ